MATGNAINANSAGLVKYDGAGTFSGVTTTQYDVLVGAASNGITNVALTNGQVLIGSTGAAPLAGTLTAGTGVTITNAANSITIASSGGGLSWTVITASTQTAAVNNGYIANYAGTLVFTLPAVSAVGTVIAVTGMNTATGWKIASPNAATQIFFGTSATTLGTTGYLQSTNIYDTVYLLCNTVNATWIVTDSIGNITVF